MQLRIDRASVVEVGAVVGETGTHVRVGQLEKRPAPEALLARVAAEVADLLGVLRAHLVIHLEVGSEHVAVRASQQLVDLARHELVRELDPVPGEAALDHLYGHTHLRAVASAVRRDHHGPLAGLCVRREHVERHAALGIVRVWEAREEVIAELHAMQDVLLVHAVDHGFCAAAAHVGEARLERDRRRLRVDEQRDPHLRLIAEPRVISGLDHEPGAAIRELDLFRAQVDLNVALDVDLGAGEQVPRIGLVEQLQHEISLAQVDADRLDSRPFVEDEELMTALGAEVDRRRPCLDHGRRALEAGEEVPGQGPRQDDHENPNQAHRSSPPQERRWRTAQASSASRSFARME